MEGVEGDAEFAGECTGVGADEVFRRGVGVFGDQPPGGGDVRRTFHPGVRPVDARGLVAGHRVREFMRQGASVFAVE